MKFHRWLTCVLGTVLLFSVMQVNAETQFEYATVHFDGPSSRIIWPDGKTEKIGEEKGHGGADTRLWMMTTGMNKLARKGFTLVALTYHDVYMQRTNTTPVSEYASVRCTGPTTSVIWADGSTEAVAKSIKEKPDDADVRMWYLTRAMNMMGKRGFRLVRSFGGTPVVPFGHNVDVVDMWAERSLVPDKQ